MRLTHSGPRSYVQLDEAYRDDAGRPKQRTVVALGRLDQLDAGLDSVNSGLLRVTGKSAPTAAPVPTTSFESARDSGDVWALTEMWNSLGFDRLKRAFRRTRHSIDVEALVREVADAHLARIIRVDMESELFTYDINDQALARAKLMDGKLLLVTNVKDLTPAEIIKRYKSLADIERGFRVLKSEIEIGPIHHRRPDRNQAHATICFIALILYRVMRTRLHASGTQHSPERALQQLRRIQHHRVTLNASQPLTGLSSIDQNQAGILAALTIKKPTLDTQLTLL